MQHKISLFWICCEEGAGNPEVKNLLLEQIHVAHLQDKFMEVHAGKFAGDELQCLQRCDLIAWRQHDLHGISLQRRCAAAMPHQEQQMQWPYDE